MSRAAEIRLAFGGEERLFRLPIGRLRALQEKTDCGPQELAERLFGNTWRVDDVRETILQGLIGGGATQAEATRLLGLYFDDLPIRQFVPLAIGVVMAALVGSEDEPGEMAGEANQPTHSPEGRSASQASTEPEPF